jgi:hypothetical protein
VNGSVKKSIPEVIKAIDRLIERKPPDGAVSIILLLPSDIGIAY